MKEHSTFDALARSWDDEGRRERARMVAEAIAAAVPGLAQARVLEYGAGTGLLAFALRGRVAHVTLADSSREMLAVAREKIAAAGAVDLSVLPLDLTTDPPPAQPFDVICSLLVLHHVPDTDALLRRLHDAVEPGGYLCLSDLDREDGSFHGHGKVPHEGFDRARLAEALARAGFTDLHFEDAFDIEKPVHGDRLRRFPAFLAVARRP